MSVFPSSEASLIAIPVCPPEVFFMTIWAYAYVEFLLFNDIDSSILDTLNLCITYTAPLH